MPIEFHAALPKGDCTIRLFGDAANRTMPVVLLFMDAFGPRPALYDLAHRLVEEGCRVLLPDLFYAHAPYEPIDPASLFSGGEDRQRLSSMLDTLSQSALDDDVAALLAVASAQCGAEAPIAAVGYCMGGRFAITAASLDPRVRLSASIHGSTLAPAEGDSAHQRLKGSQAKIYVGVAQIDPTFDAAEQGRLAESLRANDVDHLIESYVDAAHGFAMADIPAYHPAAAEKHWRRLQELLRETVLCEAT